MKGLRMQQHLNEGTERMVIVTVLGKSLFLLKRIKVRIHFNIISSAKRL